MAAQVARGGYHVCVVTTAHPVDDVRVYEKLVRSWLEAGHQVSWVGPDWRQIDSAFAGDSRVNYCLFSANKNRFDRLLSPHLLRRRARELPRADVYYAPDPDSAPVAAELAVSNGSVSIFDIHEAYHDATLRRWVGSFAALPLRRFVQWRLSRVALSCDLVLAVNVRILNCYAVSHSNALVVRSCASVRFVHRSKDRSSAKPISRRFRVMHGKAERGRGTLQVLSAVGILAKQGIDELSLILIRTVNETVHPEDKEIGRQLQALASQLEVRQPMPQSEMSALLNTCAVGLISYQRDLGQDSLPNRLFEYMASGIAVVAPNYSTEIAKILKSERCGLVVDFEDPHDIAAAIRWMLENPRECAEMGERGAAAFLQRYNWESEFDVFSRRLDATVRRSTTCR